MTIFNKFNSLKLFFGKFFVFAIGGRVDNISRMGFLRSDVTICPGYCHTVGVGQLDIVKGTTFASVTGGAAAADFNEQRNVRKRSSDSVLPT